MDHSPGPIIANALLKAANMMDNHPLPLSVNAIQNSTAAINAHAIGVQNPPAMKIPKTAAAMCGVICAASGVPRHIAIARPNKVIAITNR